ncbi:hypothetical protein G4D82_14020 [Flavobacterium sp. CYK-4]|uniref:hypothetical protein n=1 Tax=Flavobacterium lotistagni TaxID=2709660 RepID=UPI0014093E17|nr:hypothetical protein [Flavobacterium lotistagni]NHM08341.1 hypothetical protein [Flavobacterium lotistagni]
MTIRKIIELIDILKSELGKGKLQTRIQDYKSTIDNNSSNILLLKEIVDKTIDDLLELKNNDVPNALNKILVGKITPFDIEKHKKKLFEILKKNHSDYSIIYNELNTVLTEMIADLNSNLEEIEKIRKIILPFEERDLSEFQGDENAIFALIFKNEKSIDNLKAFSYELKNWDKCLFLYQQVVTDETPKAFEIIEVEQGSIEVIINLSFEVAEKLLDVFTAGMSSYSAYLAYKTIVKENLSKTFNGNSELLELEEKREKLMLQNVKETVRKELKKQAKKDKKEAQEKKIEEITRLLTEHIIKGNTVKLLSAPEEKEEVFDKENERKTLYNKSLEDYKKLDKATKLFLLENFIKDLPEDDYE